MVLVIIWLFPRVVGRREHRALLAGLPKQGFLSGLLMEKAGGSFLKILPFMCFLIGVYVVCSCRNRVVETKAVDDTTYACKSSGVSLGLEGAQKISEVNKTPLLCWPDQPNLAFTFVFRIYFYMGLARLKMQYKSLILTVLGFLPYNPRVPDARLPHFSLCLSVSPGSHTLPLSPAVTARYSTKHHLSSSPMPIPAPSFAFGGS